MQKSLKVWILPFIFAIGLSANLHAQPNQTSYPTYFQYTKEELSQLPGRSSSFQMSKDDLKKWDSFTRNLLINHPLKNSNAERLYAYLYTAQRDAAFLSFNSHGNFVGSLDPISLAVIQLFFSGEVQQPTIQVDDYSNYLAQIVFIKIKERFDKENANLTEVKLENGEHLWDPGKEESYGLNVSSWTPWFISSSYEFRAPAPPEPRDPFWESQAKLTKDFQKNLTDEQKRAILFWAGREDPESGDWRKIANDYMFSRNVPFAKMLLVRAVLTEGMCDTSIAVFDSKYIFQIKRPFMIDSSIKSPIKCPNHPSYPSGHSTVSGFSAALLAHYFPNGKERWFEMAEEAGYSRLWAGIHFPIDHEAGFQMGQKIAQSVSQMPKNNL